MLISFLIDMQTGQFDLTFSDIALARTLDASAIGIQDGRYASDTSSVRLATLSTTSSSDGYYSSVLLICSMSYQFYDWQPVKTPLG